MRGIHRSPVNSTKASDAELWCLFFLRLDKRLSKPPWGWWFEAPSRPLWRPCKVYSKDLSITACSMCLQNQNRCNNKRKCRVNNTTSCLTTTFCPVCQMNEWMAFGCRIQIWQVSQQHTVNNIATDDLATHGAKLSAAMVLIHYSWNICNSAPDEVTPLDCPFCDVFRIQTGSSWLMAYE